MRVAIHQPHYWPWLSYLYKMREADVFVYLDKVAYEKNGFQNRNRVLIDSKEHWLTVPVLTKGKLGQLIKDVKVNWDNRWNQKQYHTLLYNYPKAMRDKSDAIRAFFEWDGKLLIDWNIKSIDFLCRIFKIDTRKIFESELDINGAGSERLVNICRAVGADTYLSGPTGREYLKEEMFGDIKVEYMDWKPKGHLSTLHYYLKRNLKVLEV